MSKSKNQIVMLAVALAGAYAILREEVPIGVNNNNPLNIRHYPANNWDGMVGVDNKGFVIFNSAVMGFRAAAKLINNDVKSGKGTIDQLINEWSPVNGENQKGEKYVNNTENYIVYVSDKMRVPRDVPLTSVDYVALLSAMIYFENGIQPYPIEKIARGVDLALEVA